MFIPHEGPGTWQSFLKRKDNVGLTIMEARQKYLKEQLLFESYFQTLNTTSTVSTAAAGAAGGPAPSTGGGGGGGGEWDLEFTVDTNYSYAEAWDDGYGATVSLPSTAVCISNSGIPDFRMTLTPTSGGEITVDWGDGTVETLSEYNFQWNLTFYPFGSFRHDYATDGQYQIKIKGPGASTVKFFSIPVISIEKIDHTTIEWNGLFAASPPTGIQIPLPNWVAKPTDPLNGMFGPVGNMNNATNGKASGFNADISTWDVSNVTQLRFFSAYNTYLSSDLSNWDVSNVNHLGVFAAKASLGQFTGWQNWNLSSFTGLSNTLNRISDTPSPATAGYTLPNRVPVTSWFDGWVFDPTVTSFSFTGMFAESLLSDASVIGDWIISMANDINTPDNLSLDGNNLSSNFPIYLSANPTTFVYISNLGLSSDPGVSAAISTLQGKGWTITNL
jgi:hypothetical protein